MKHRNIEQYSIEKHCSRHNHTCLDKFAQDYCRLIMIPDPSDEELEYIDEILQLAENYPEFGNALAHIDEQLAAEIDSSEEFFQTNNLHKQALFGMSKLPKNWINCFCQLIPTSKTSKIQPKSNNNLVFSLSTATNAKQTEDLTGCIGQSRKLIFAAILGGITTLIGVCAFRSCCFTETRMVSNQKAPFVFRQNLQQLSNYGGKIQTELNQLRHSHFSNNSLMDVSVRDSDQENKSCVDNIKHLNKDVSQYYFLVKDLEKLASTQQVKLSKIQIKAKDIQLQAEKKQKQLEKQQIYAEKQQIHAEKRQQNDVAQKWQMNAVNLQLKSEQLLCIAQESLALAQ
jgi:hypothetical protein